MITFNKIKRFIKTLAVRARHRSLGGIKKRLELNLLGSHSSTRAPNPPSHVMIEITTRCNLSCTYCSLNDKSYRKAHTGDLALDDVLKILPSTKGVKVLVLYGLGEPLLYKEMEVIIKEARKYVPFVSFTSNGLLLDDERSRSLKEAGLSWIQISLDSLDPEYHRRIRGGDVNKILKNLEAFSKITDLPVHLWSVVTAENIDDLTELPELKSRIPTLELLHFQLLQGDHLLEKHNLDSCIPVEKMKVFKENIQRQSEELGIETDVNTLPDEQPQGYTKGVCPAPWTWTTYINREGFVAPCCVLREVSLDNVLELGLKKTWNGPKIQQFRQELLDGNYMPTCQNSCGYYCNGKNSHSHLDRTNSAEFVH